MTVPGMQFTMHVPLWKSFYNGKNIRDHFFY
jgi:hypothetical protein